MNHKFQINFVAENNILARIIKLENDSQRTEQRVAGIENELKALRRALVKQRKQETNLCTQEKNKTTLFEAR